MSYTTAKFKYPNETHKQEEAWGIFFRFYSSNSLLMAEIDIFFDRIKQKKWIKLKKYTNFVLKLEKLGSNLEDKYYENGWNA